MEGLAKELPQVGGTFLQAEDEIAAITAVLGASFGGARAMTATSGPGFSLMSEAIGYASMAELPVVIVDAQRAGPSTGMPTKMEQSDLSFALSTGHGDTPRIVVAPADVADCYTLMIEAFNMAERYQMPVIFLTDQSLTARVESVDRSVFKPMETVGARVSAAKRRQWRQWRGEQWTRGQLPAEEEHAFARYAYTASGISPTSAPGHGALYLRRNRPGTRHSRPSRLRAGRSYRHDGETLPQAGNCR